MTFEKPSDFEIKFPFTFVWGALPEDRLVLTSANSLVDPTSGKHLDPGGDRTLDIVRLMWMLSKFDQDFNPAAQYMVPTLDKVKKGSGGSRRDGSSGKGSGNSSGAGEVSGDAPASSTLAGLNTFVFYKAAGSTAPHLQGLKWAVVATCAMLGPDGVTRCNCPIVIGMPVGDPSKLGVRYPGSGGCCHRLGCSAGKQSPLARRVLCFVAKTAVADSIKGTLAMETGARMVVGAAALLNGNRLMATTLRPTTRKQQQYQRQEAAARRTRAAGGASSSSSSGLTQQSLAQQRVREAAARAKAASEAAAGGKDKDIQHGWLVTLDADEDNLFVITGTADQSRLLAQFCCCGRGLSQVWLVDGSGGMPLDLNGHMVMVTRGYLLHPRSAVEGVSRQDRQEGLTNLEMVHTGRSFKVYAAFGTYMMNQLRHIMKEARLAADPSTCYQATHRQMALCRCCQPCCCHGSKNRNQPRCSAALKRWPAAKRRHSSPCIGWGSKTPLSRQLCWSLWSWSSPMCWSLRRSSSGSRRGSS